MPDGIAELSSRWPGVEVCGLLLTEGRSAFVTDFISAPGPFRTNDFELPPQWHLRECLRQRALGRRVVGYFHTHPPGHDIEPSDKDRAGHPPGSLVLIVCGVHWRAYRTTYEGWTPL